MLQRRSRIFAVAYHRAILDSLAPLTVQSVFPRALHLRRTDGQILSVTCAPYDGPMAIRLKRDSLADLNVHLGMVARLTPAALIVGPVWIHLRGAIRWAPRSAALAPPIDWNVLRRDVDEVVDWVVTADRGGLGCFLRVRSDGVFFGGGGTWATTRVAVTGGLDPPGPSVLADMEAALAAGDAAAIEECAYGLLGLGPGLTPAGDDVLVGLITGLGILGRRLAAPTKNYQIAAEPSSPQPPFSLNGRRGAFICGARSPSPAHREKGPGDEGSREQPKIAIGAIDLTIERHAFSRTTALSATLLHQARRQVALQPLLDVVWTLGTGVAPSSVQTLLDIGHSSGRDMLTGVAMAATAVVRWEEAHDSSLAGQT